MSDIDASRELYKQHGLRMVDGKSLLGAVVQIPFVLGLYQTLRNGVGSAAFLRVRNMGRPDAILAILAAVTTAAAMTIAPNMPEPTNFDNLAQSLGVSPPTSKAWVELLEKLYIVFLLPPYSNSLARSIRKDRRIYFFDEYQLHWRLRNAATFARFPQAAALQYMRRWAFV